MGGILDENDIHQKLISTQNMYSARDNDCKGSNTSLPTASNPNAKHKNAQNGSVEVLRLLLTLKSASHDN